MTAEPRKRAAYELPRRSLDARDAGADMSRPAATTAGAVLIFLRVVAGAVWLVQATVLWRSGDPAGIVFHGEGLPAFAVTIGMTAMLTVGTAYLAAQALLAVLILRGRNWPRMVVMVFAVGSISTTFFAWWEEGQQITIQTTLLTLGLDILILLALSSRNAAAFARRRHR